LNNQELFSLEGRTALITGGARGIGRMIAEGYVRAGAKVYLTARATDAAHHAARQIAAGDGRCVGLGANLASEEGCAALVASLSALEPHLDILVNNAGAAWFASLDETGDAAWDRVLALNLKAVSNLTRLALPLLRAGPGPGRIINIGSVDGMRPSPFESFAYSASKAGLHHLTQQLARHLAPEVTVNALAPGPFPTKMIEAGIQRHGDTLLEATPMHRFGATDDIVGPAVFLGSRASAYVTGVVLPVDGGQSVGRY
jgi:NAD(P)-dependent dehydrogenase (short-subunit alcohol dehydrogenase family)